MITLSTPVLEKLWRPNSRSAYLAPSLTLYLARVGPGYPSEVPVACSGNGGRNEGLERKVGKWTS